MTSFSLKIVAFALGLLIFAGSPCLRALDLPTSFTLDLPFPPGKATPAWLGQPIVPPTNFATLNLPIQPADVTKSLLVTVYFEEKTGGFMRITWQGERTAQLLCDNFYEGIGMSNQRRLLIPPEVLGGKGNLLFQSGETGAIGISRIKLEWLEKRTELVSPQVSDDLVTPASGETQPTQDLAGLPKMDDSATWHGHIVTVPIASAAQRIEAGVEFSVEMASVPTAARLSLHETGLPMGQDLVVWINQQRAGEIIPTVPDLQDEGYKGDGTAVYAGWLPGTFYLPVNLLKAGVNTVQFSAEDKTEPDAAPEPTATKDDATPSAPLAVKDVVLQLRYPAPPASVAPVPAPTTLSQIP